MIPSCKDLNVKIIKPNRFFMYKIRGFREKLVCVIVSHFYVYRSVVTRGGVYLTYAKKQQWRTSVKIMKNRSYRFDTAI